MPTFYRESDKCKAKLDFYTTTAKLSFLKLSLCLTTHSTKPLNFGISSIHCILFTANRIVVEDPGD